jgi:uncharacterized protein (UPF0332 family)
MSINLRIAERLSSSSLLFKHSILSFDASVARYSSFESFSFLSLHKKIPSRRHIMHTIHFSLPSCVSVLASCNKFMNKKSMLMLKATLTSSSFLFARKQKNLRWSVATALGVSIRRRWRGGKGIFPRKFNVRHQPKPMPVKCDTFASEKTRKH